ncbi:hypothetical protein JKP88DRAFT_234931 [Tribonema minus]|uniref:Uncharacterized protein n=1 Tax=Tribonema minus TaxID=303371 RepID=A0A835ZAA3_9STRA|nr:hypothetical protein JKP88DRAFT_234931 [Tribonema minus]
MRTGLSRQLEAWPGLLRDLLTALLQLAAFQSAVWDRLDACAEALLPIIVCDQHGYQALATALVEQQSPDARPRLAAALHALVTDNGLTMDLKRDTRRRFVENLRRFAGDVRAFLMVR